MLSFLDGNQYSYPRSFSSPHSTYSEGTSLLQSLELLAPRACSWRACYRGESSQLEVFCIFLCSLKKQLVSVPSGLKGQWVLYSWRFGVTSNSMFSAWWKDGSVLYTYCLQFIWPLTPHLTLLPHQKVLEPASLGGWYLKAGRTEKIRQDGVGMSGQCWTALSLFQKLQTYRPKGKKHRTKHSIVNLPTSYPWIGSFAVSTCVSCNSSSCV